MRKLAMLVLACTMVAGCASKPANYASTLATSDPKWDSAECKEIRLAALNFNDKVGQRMAIGLAAGLLLGPFGIPIAAAADADQNETRRLFNREMHLRCSSKPLPKDLERSAAAPVKQTASPRSR